MTATASARSCAVSPAHPHDWVWSRYTFYIQRGTRKYEPWALADAARVCLAYGTEHNRADTSEQDLLQILNAYSRFEDPGCPGDARACLLRMADQQMTWQGLEPQALARTAAIFTQTLLLKPAKCLRSGWDAEVFGCTLQEYVGTAQLLWASAVKCAGRFDLALRPPEPRVNGLAKPADQSHSVMPRRHELLRQAGIYMGTRHILAMDSKVDSTSSTRSGKLGYPS